MVGAIVISSSNKHALSHAEAEPLDAKVCEDTLRKVFSWLEVPDLLCSASLVSKRWAQAAACKEVFRRRMHAKVLDSLFNPQHKHLLHKQQLRLSFADCHSNNSSNSSSNDDSSSSSDANNNSILTGNDQQQQQQEWQHEQEHNQEQQQEQQAEAAAEVDPLAAAIAAIAAAAMSPARLFAQLYGSNLLGNGSFLERHNSHKGAQRRLVWEPTFNPRGMTWAHPFDFFPELCPLPEEQGFGATPAKPFSIGCLATASGAWSEVVQVVDLQSSLQSAGLPGATAAWLTTAAGLKLEFSVLVAGGAAAGGEYQVVVSLISAADAAAAANNEVPLSSLPKMTLPFGHPPPGCPGIAAVSAAQLQARGFNQGSKTLARAPLHPPPGVWTRFSCRAVLPTDTPISHVVIALRGRATRNSRLGHYAMKFADARLKFLTADKS